MKAIFISYNQSLTERIQDILDRRGARGYTKWETTQGRGSSDGEPHLGSHAWPSMNSSVITMVEDSKVKPLMDALCNLDAEMPTQGLRAFVLPIEEQL